MAASHFGLFSQKHPNFVLGAPACFFDAKTDSSSEASHLIALLYRAAFPAHTLYCKSGMGNQAAPSLAKVQ